MESAPLRRDDLREVVFLIGGLFFLLQGAVWLANALVLTTFERPCQVSLGCINGLSAEAAVDFGLAGVNLVVGLVLMFLMLRTARRRRSS